MIMGLLWLGQQRSHDHDRLGTLGRVDQDGNSVDVAAACPEDASVPEQMRVRLGKRQRLLDEGVDPYPVGFPRTATIAEVRARYPELEPDTYTGDRVGVTGR